MTSLASMHGGRVKARAPTQTPPYPEHFPRPDSWHGEPECREEVAIVSLAVSEAD